MAGVTGIDVIEFGVAIVKAVVVEKDKSRKWRKYLVDEIRAHCLMVIEYYYCVALLLVVILYCRRNLYD